MEVPTKAELRKLRVVDLRKKLHAVELTQSGNKEDLISRLHQYYLEQAEANREEEKDEATGEGGGKEEDGEGGEEEKTRTEEDERPEEAMQTEVAAEQAESAPPPAEHEPSAQEAAFPVAMEEEPAEKEAEEEGRGEEGGQEVMEEEEEGRSGEGEEAVEGGVGEGGRPREMAEPQEMMEETKAEEQDHSHTTAPPQGAAQSLEEKAVDRQSEMSSQDLPPPPSQPSPPHVTPPPSHPTPSHVPPPPSQSSPPHMSQLPNTDTPPVRVETGGGEEVKGETVATVRTVPGISVDMTGKEEGRSAEQHSPQQQEQQQSERASLPSHPPPTVSALKPNAAPSITTSDYYSDSGKEENSQTGHHHSQTVQPEITVPMPSEQRPAERGGQSQVRQGAVRDVQRAVASVASKPAERGAKEAEMKGKKKKKKRRRRRHNQGERAGGDEEEESGPHKPEVEIEYVQEDVLKPGDVHYRQFHKIFEAFKLTEKEKEAPPPATPTEETPMSIAALSAAAQRRQREQEAEESDEEEPKEPAKLSKKKLRKMNRLTVAQLKQLVDRPDVVEMHDVTAHDPRLLIHLKSTRNTAQVPRHWCFKRKYLQGKRGIEKPPFDLPDFIKATGIMEMRQALEEKEEAKSLKQKTRERVRPKMGKLTIDYQKLHDAFFKWQTKPKMTIHGDLYYEGKEFETRLREKKPGDLSDELRRSLGMPTGMGKQKFPPPWLVAMQRYGPPPSYPNLKIPGLNAPIPDGCSFGYFVGGWGKPPVDEVGRPLYGDVFGLDQQDNVPKVHEDDIDKQLWGELESEEEMEEEEESEEEGEVALKPDEIQAGLITPLEGGLVTPSGLTSIPAGLETPEMIQLRKKKIEEAMEQGGDTPALYTVLPEKTASVGGAMVGSSHVYDLSAAVPGTKKAGGGSLPEGVEVALDPSELDLDAATMTARYEEQLKETKLQKEDLSDMVAEHAAKQKKRKRAAADTGGSKATKKLKEFKF